MRAAAPAAVVAALIACLSGLASQDAVDLRGTKRTAEDFEACRYGRAALLVEHTQPVRLRGAADLMQASAVIASVVYQAANQAERLPRRERPAAPAGR